jgi:Secretion system C-terminal sorting domain
MKFTLHTTRKISFTAFILGLCLFSTQIAFSQGVLKTWDGGAGTNAWSDAANWDLDVLPANIDSVIIAAGQNVQVTSGTAVCRKLGIYGSLTVTAALTVDAATVPANTNNISPGHAVITLFGGMINNQGTMTVTGRQNLDAIRFDNPASGTVSSTYMGAGSLTCNTTSAAGTGSTAPTGGNNGTIMTFAQTNGTATFTTSSSATYTFNLNTGGTKSAFYCPRGTAKIDGTGTITISGAVRSIRVIPTAANETPNLTIESGVTLNLSTTGTTASIGVVLLDPGTVGASASMTNKGTLNFSGDVGHPIYMTNAATAVGTTNFTNQGTINIEGTFNIAPSTPAVANNSGGIFMAGGVNVNTNLGNFFTNSGSINFNRNGGTSAKPLFICSVSPKNLLTNSGTITVGTGGTPPIALRLGDAETTVNNTGTITIGAGSIEGVMAAPPTIVGNALFNNNAGGTINFNSTTTTTNNYIAFINAGGAFNLNTTQRVGRFTANGGTVAIADGTTFTTFFLTLTSGNIPIGTGNIVMESGGSITGGSLASHITTNGTGTLTQTHTVAQAGTDKIYPIGQSASSYDPVTINYGVEANFSTRVGLKTTAGTSSGILPVNREWDITNAGAPSSAFLTFVTSALNVNGTNTRPPVGGSGSGLVGHYNGSNWDANMTADYTTDTWFLADYMGSFSPFIVGTPGTIPIELLGVTAKAVNDKNVVAWETATEINNKGFDVQRQNANGTWATLGFVKGENKPSTYTFEDKGPLSISYYRLRQMDFDGKESLSKVVSVRQTQKGQIQISPNPTSDKVNIFLSNNDRLESTTITVYDLIGRQVLTQKTTANAFELDMSNLAKGTYLVKIDANNSVYTEKIIRQ